MEYPLRAASSIELIFLSLVHDVAFADGGADLAEHGGLVEGGVFGFGEGGLGVVGPLGGGGGEDEVGVAAWGEGAPFFQVDDAGGVGGHELEGAGGRQGRLAGEAWEGEGQGGSDAGDGG